METRKDFYVYFHRDRAGDIFYVGKGTGRRAWSLDRHAAWKKYVAERLAGYYSVEIHADGLTEQEAEELEDSLINHYGKQLINWINYGRDFDYTAIDLYHKLRNANRAYVADTRLLESTDASQAVVQYRQALVDMRKYEAMTLERGLVAEMGVGPNWGDPNILDRLTICLIKLGRFNEAIEEADRYFSSFPSALKLAIGKRIITRINKLREKAGK
ncbi:MAG: hypothetical protein E6Q50_13280 [Lysobacter sp.]|nr:MAG: hypothetical protein E6Q50_13280 [Lysobacter sp.]